MKVAMHKVNLRLPVKWVAIIKKRAEKEELSVSEVIRKILEKAL